MTIYEDLLTNYEAKLIAGGAAQNSARGAAYILPPNSVVYVGGVGDDKYAAILKDAVRAVGLRVEYRVDKEVPTGRCGVVITGHNRSMCTALGAANHYDLEHLKKPEIWSLAEGAEVFYIGGYHLTGKSLSLIPFLTLSIPSSEALVWMPGPKSFQASPESKGQI